MTSAGTIIIGLMLMGTTKFKLFSTTGPSVAMGLALSLLATLTLTPALLVLLARLRPRSFQRFMRLPAECGIDWGGRPWPVRCGAGAWPSALFRWPLWDCRVTSSMDLLSEMPRQTESGESLRLVASKFDAGMMAPLTVVLESDTDLRRSEGLTLIDDVSRLLSHQRRLTEVRSATQPLGSPEPLNRARLASRLGEVNQGFRQLSEGAKLLNKGLIKVPPSSAPRSGSSKRPGSILPALSAALVPRDPPRPAGLPRGRPRPPRARGPASASALVTGLKGASTALLVTQGTPPWDLPGLSKAFDLWRRRPSRSRRLRPAVPTPRYSVPAMRSHLRPRVAASAGANDGPAETLLAELTERPTGPIKSPKGADRAMPRLLRSSMIRLADEHSIAC